MEILSCGMDSACVSFVANRFFRNFLGQLSSFISVLNSRPSMTLFSAKLCEGWYQARVERRLLSIV
jgi:hypothetical protein